MARQTPTEKKAKVTAKLCVMYPMIQPMICARIRTAGEARAYREGDDQDLIGALCAPLALKVLRGCEEAGGRGARTMHTLGKMPAMADAMTWLYVDRRPIRSTSPRGVECGSARRQRGEGGARCGHAAPGRLLPLPCRQSPLPRSWPQTGRPARSCRGACRQELARELELRRCAPGAPIRASVVHRCSPISAGSRTPAS